LVSREASKRCPAWSPAVSPKVARVLEEERGAANRIGTDGEDAERGSVFDLTLSPRRPAAEQPETYGRPQGAPRVSSRSERASPCSVGRKGDGEIRLSPRKRGDRSFGRLEGGPAVFDSVDRPTPANIIEGTVAEPLWTWLSRETV
jgi:hypothetical protein